MTDSSHENPVTRASITGPGAQIRSAREAAKLSIEDLAAQLKLSRHTLDALERDDFATLTESVYVRGYYRKLSKVLPLSEAELISQYVSVATPRVAVAPSKLILSGNQDLNPGSPWNRALIATGVIVVALVIALAAFWASRRGEQGPEPAVLTVPAPKVQVRPPPETALPAAPAPSPAPVSSGEAHAPKAAAVPPSAVVLDKPAAVATSPGLATLVAAAPASAAAPAAGTQKQSQLTLEYAKNCWTRIEDAEGKTIVSGIIPAGEKLNYSGTPPFSISFGNALAVTLKLDGMAVDMSQFTKSNGTARFSLP